MQLNIDTIQITTNIPACTTKQELKQATLLKGRCVGIVETLQREELEQLHLNHMGIKKTKLLACESVYWTGMNNDIENHIKIALHVLIFSKLGQRKK